MENNLSLAKVHCEPLFKLSESMNHLDELNFAVVDVETTGLSAAYGERVCEVGIVRARGDAVLDTYQSLVNPQRLISPGAARVNGLRDEDVSHAPLFAEIADQVLEWIDGALLVCHNAPFDLSFLDSELSRLGRSWQPAGVIDTLEIARRNYNFASNSLPNVAAVLGIQTPDAHRALGDALTTFQVFRHFRCQLTRQGLIQMQGLVREYRPAQHWAEEMILPPSIQEALTGKREVEITYIDQKGDETIRCITPLSVQEMRGTVYLVAYCHLRQAERTFRLDRIVAIGRVEEQR